MRKDLYLKPEVTSDVLEPGALAQSGSPAGGGGDGGPIQITFPLFGLCCD